MAAYNDSATLSLKRERMFGEAPEPTPTQAEMAQRIARDMLKADHQALEREIRAECSPLPTG